MDQEPQIEELQKENEQVHQVTQPSKMAGNILNQLLHNLQDKNLQSKFKSYYSDKRKQINNTDLVNIAIKSQDYPQFLINNIQEILNEIVAQNIGFGIFNQILLLIQNDKIAKEFDNSIIQNIIKQHQNILSFDSLQLLDQVFELQLPQQFWLDLFEKSIKKKEFKFAFKVYQECKFNLEKFDQLINAMNNQSNCSLALQFIKSLQIPLSQYPMIQKQQYKNSVFYFYTQYPLCKVEEMMKQEKGLLMELVYLLDKKNKQKDAASIIKRQNLLPFIEDKQLLQFYQYYVNNPDFVEQQNILFEKDYFGPTEYIFSKKPEYLTSKELGYQEQQIKYFDDFDEIHKQAWNDILNSEYIALDCEYTCNLVNTDNTDTVLQLLQIANDKYTYVIDLFALQNDNEFLETIKKLLNSELIVIGLGVNQDIELLEKFSKCQNNLKIYDIAIEFKKAKIIDSNKSNLAFITETMLQKPLSKFEQKSDWVCRPIRKCQLHYAAMDAIVCVKIYQVLQQRQQQCQQIEKIEEENPIQQQQYDSQELDKLLSEIHQLVQQKQNGKAFELIKKCEQNQDKAFKILVDSIKCDDYQMLKIARNYVNELNLDIQQYPVLYRDELYEIAKSIKNRPLLYIMDRVGNNSDLLIQIIKQYYNNRERELEAAILLQEFNLFDKIKDKRMLGHYRDIMNEPKFYVNKNILLATDHFGPKPDNFEDYLTTQELGYQQQQVVLVDQSGQYLHQAWQCIEESQVIGIDSQFYYGNQNTSQNIHIQTISIATQQYVFIFNLFTINQNEFIQYLDGYLNKTKSKIIGYQIYKIFQKLNKQFSIRKPHQLQDYDLEIISKNLKIVNQDIGTLTKCILNKPIKNSTSQIFIQYRNLTYEEVHYLGLRAIVCLKIYEILLKRFGEQIIEVSLIPEKKYVKQQCSYVKKIAKQ